MEGSFPSADAACCCWAGDVNAADQHHPAAPPLVGDADCNADCDAVLQAMCASSLLSCSSVMPTLLPPAAAAAAFAVAAGTASIFGIEPVSEAFLVLVFAINSAFLLAAPISRDSLQPPDAGPTNIRSSAAYNRSVCRRYIPHKSLSSSPSPDI